MYTPRKGEILYRTTRDVGSGCSLETVLGQEIPNSQMQVLVNAGTYIFKGSKSAFSKFLRQLNQQHGEGYAVEA